MNPPDHDHDGNAALRFWVAGVPQTRGSKRAFAFKRTNGTLGVSVADSNPKSKDWMGVVRQAAIEQCPALASGPLSGPVDVALTFYLPRPKGHYGSGRNAGTLKASADKHHAKKPDLCKLIRPVEDALSGVAWNDDAQLVGYRRGTRKVYTTGMAGVMVSVYAL